MFYFWFGATPYMARVYFWHCTQESFLAILRDQMGCQRLSSDQQHAFQEPSWIILSDFNWIVLTGSFIKDNKDVWQSCYHLNLDDAYGIWSLGYSFLWLENLYYHLQVSFVQPDFSSDSWNIVLILPDFHIDFNLIENYSQCSALLSCWQQRLLLDVKSIAKL